MSICALLLNKLFERVLWVMAAEAAEHQDKSATIKFESPLRICVIISRTQKRVPQMYRNLMITDVVYKVVFPYEQWVTLRSAIVYENKVE